VCYSTPCSTGKHTGSVEDLNVKFNGGLVALGGALYLLGAATFYYRVPERLIPHVFDYWGNSHQLFHIMVLAGCLCHYAAFRGNMDWWHGVYLEPHARLPS
jgi:channel protein (hemolysin III family)